MSSEPARSPLTITSQLVGPVMVLAAVGEIDVGSADELQRAFASALYDGAPEIWLDLSKTTFIDCSGLRALLDLRAGLALEDRRVVLVCPSRPVRRLLDLTETATAFVIHPSAPGDGV